MTKNKLVMELDARETQYEVSAITHTEDDLLLRFVEIWYDTLWAYFISAESGISSGKALVKGIDKRNRRENASAAYESSSTVVGSVLGKNVQDKLTSLQRNLRDVRHNISYDEFRNCCTVGLKSSDTLYPGFKDVMLIVRYLLRESPKYRGMLTEQEIASQSLTTVFQNFFYQLCDFLLRSKCGSEAMKMLIVPTKITHATYDICRQKFCHLLCNETEIITYGLLRLIKKVCRYREKECQKAIEKPAAEEEEAPDEQDDENESVPVPLTIEVEESEEDEADMVKLSPLLSPTEAKFPIVELFDDEASLSPMGSEKNNDVDW